MEETKTWLREALGSEWSALEGGNWDVVWHHFSSTPRGWVQEASGQAYSERGILPYVSWLESKGRGRMGTGQLEKA